MLYIKAFPLCVRANLLSPPLKVSHKHNSEQKKPNTKVYIYYTIPFIEISKTGKTKLWCENSDWKNGGYPTV